MSSIRAIRGMQDILPDAAQHWQQIERTAAAVLRSYGYGEIRLPLVEYTELFQRSIGEVTDIVEKEMYSFDDRNGESLSLRPEGTAGCVRAAIQQGLLGVPRRLWYAGPMFRYERPQKGRQRQFHQLGVEVFGVATADIDAELILLGARLWRALGVADGVQLQLNSIGSAASRQRYRSALVEFLSGNEAALDEDSRRRLHTNPLRILDSKQPATQALLDDAPELADYLDDQSQADFAELCQLLDTADLPYVINQRLVRGLDYYNNTVFEWVTDKLGAQGTVCAGGRYDGLVAQLGGKATPGIGFAVGLERLVLLCAALGEQPQEPAPIDIYVVAAGDAVYRSAVAQVEALRSELPECRIVQHVGGGSFKNQLKKADKSGAMMALIWGEDEVRDAAVTLKPLRDRSDQRTVPAAQLSAAVRTMLAVQD